MEALCCLSAVCGHWRTVTLSNPLLWRHIEVRFHSLNAQDNTDRKLESRRISAQIQRSRDAPLIVTFNASQRFRIPPLLDLLLMSSTRWQRAKLNLAPEHIAHISQTGGSFSHLSTLDLEIQEFSSNTSTFFKSLCALTHLKLATMVPIPRDSGIPWGQLRACSLCDVSLQDVVHILPLLPPHSSLSLMCSAWHGPLPPQIVSSISGLLFDNCDADFVGQLLAHLKSPALKKLAIRNDEEAATREELEQILQYLLRSQCALTDLALVIDESSIYSLFELLESEPVRGIVDLECYIFYNNLRPTIFSLLANHPQLLPELRVLALRTYSSALLDDSDEDLLELCHARRQSLRELWIELPQRKLRQLNEVTVSRLRAGGLYVVVSPSFGDRWY
ncbi:hypothetical protein C8F01DRAFT_626193 [Mycena amicta]|nr:hypothetical protein C8F01DRAFT_626193 [Mycena amicta]